MPFNFYEWKDYFWLNNVELGKYLYKFWKSYEKYIPEEIKKANKEEIKNFLETFCLWDWSKRKGKFWKWYQFNPSISYFTSSKKMAEDLGELVMKKGKGVNFKIMKVKGKKQTFKNGDYFINNDVWIINELTRTKIKRENLSKEIKDYNNFVYDVELEKYHVLLVRRNWNVVWSGNCRCTLIPIL